jgi:hypothetical protein
MQATLAIREKMAQLLAADTATLAQAADANVVALVMEEFNPSEASAIGDLTLSTFDGDTPLEAELGAQAEGLDPTNNDAIITILPPVGGWRWETTGTTNLPQTIYGFALVTDAGVLLGCETLETPITLTGVNQVIQLPVVAFRQLANSLT